MLSCSLCLTLSFSPLFSLFVAFFALFIRTCSTLLAAAVDREAGESALHTPCHCRYSQNDVGFFWKMKVCLLLCKSPEIVVSDFIKSSCWCDSPSERGSIIFRVSGEVEYNLSVICFFFFLRGQLRPPYLTVCHPPATVTRWLHGQTWSVSELLHWNAFHLSAVGSALF